MAQTTAREQFVEDYTLVIDNDFEAYTEILDKAETATGNVSGLSDTLREEFESYISQVVEREREQGNTTGADLIGQLLIGNGSSVFDDIARHYIDKNLEQRLYTHFNSLLKTGE